MPHSCFALLFLLYSSHLIEASTLKRRTTVNKTTAQIIDALLPGDSNGDLLNQALRSARNTVVSQITHRSSPEGIAMIVGEAYDDAGVGLHTEDRHMMRGLTALIATQLGAGGYELQELYRNAGLTPPESR